MTKGRILVVDDEVTLTVVIEDILVGHGCEVTVANSAEDGLALLEALPTPFDVALVDIVLPGMNGLELLAEIKRRSPSTEVLMMTSHSSMETVLKAIRHGAYDYLQKPFDDIEEVWINVRRALEKTELFRKYQTLIGEKETHNRELGAAVMRLTSFIEAGLGMSRLSALSDILDFFVGLVATELGVERASLMLCDGDARTLRIAAHRGLQHIDPETIRVPFGQGVAGRVAESGEAFLLREPAGPSNRVPDPSRENETDALALCVPITSSDEVLGVINITNRTSGSLFDENDVAYLSGMAGQLAVAIQRATHHRALEEAYESLQATQQQLILSERRKAIGEMAAGIAHDFNNDLSVILGKTQIALRRLDPLRLETITELRADLETIVKVSLRSAETVKRVQDHTRMRTDSPSAVVDLNSVVREAVEMSRPKWRDQCEALGVSIAMGFELGDIGPVEGHVHELTQVVSNLIFNAVDAMPRGGGIHFRSTEVDGRVLLEISDTGVGMDDSTASQVFEPFFTTKETGSGLGMSIIYGIVTRHRGSIDVESQLGKGTTFRISLPRLATDRPPESSAEIRFENRSARVLLIEDERSVRKTLEEMLVAEGHDVATAGTGREGIEVLAQCPYDVVITDLNMPEMNGYEVARAVKQIATDLPVVLLSGWSLAKNDERNRSTDIDFVMTKPCSIDALSRVVQRALTSRVETS